MLNSSQNPIDTSVFRIVEASISDPAAGSPRILPCYSNSRMRINNIIFQITTALAGTRSQVWLSPAAGSDILMHMSTTAQGFLTTTDYFLDLSTRNELYLAGSNLYYSWLAPEFIICPGDSIIFTANNMSPAVQIQNIFIGYDQWIIA